MITKPAKTPPLNSKTKLLSFDVETNGLHGPAFAVGAVVMTADGTVHDQFSARCEINSKVDEWVEQNVMPVIGDIPVTCSTYKSLRQAFWKWYVDAEDKSDYVLVSNGYPVEYRFLIECQEDDLDERYWQHPFPILDLVSLLIQVGQQSALSKGQLMNEIIKEGNFSRHHPVHDAKMAALAAFKAFKLAGRL